MSNRKPIALPGKSEWQKQITGVIAGGLIGFMLGVLFPGLATRFGLPALILWCAVIGGVFNSAAGFMRAGALITHSDNRWLNFVVGLGLPLAVIAILYTLLNINSR